MSLISPSPVSLPRFITNPVIVYLEENEDDNKDLCKRELQDENFAEDGSKNDLIEYYEETSYLAEGLRVGI